MPQLIRPLAGRSGSLRAHPTADTFAHRLVPNAFSGTASSHPDPTTIHFVFGVAPDRRAETRAATDLQGDVGIEAISRGDGNFRPNDLALLLLPPVHNGSPAGVPYYIEVSSTDSLPFRPRSYAATLHPGASQTPALPVPNRSPLDGFREGSAGRGCCVPRDDARGEASGSTVALQQAPDDAGYPFLALDASGDFIVAAHSA